MYYCALEYTTALTTTFTGFFSPLVDCESDRNSDGDQGSLKGEFKPTWLQQPLADQSTLSAVIEFEFLHFCL